MFNFLKPKPKTARPTFAPLGIDIHCHLLPSVDDGSKSNEESIACLRIMHEAGFNKVICTPHYQYPRFPNEESDIQQRFADMKLDLASQGVSSVIPELAGVAGEYRVDTGFTDRMATNKFLLVGGHYLLAEFSLHQQVMGLDEILFELQMKNYEVILAHPERYPYYKGWVEFLGTDMHNTLYAQALIDASHDHKIIKLLDTHKFLNSQVFSANAGEATKI